MIIRMLPIEVSKKIKAGEVVEDPSCVVRELLDNSIDAGATDISLDISGAGFHSIYIKDNGHGMIKEDMEICFLEHTTSKINQFEDIFSITTRGFRGEALSSICKVSHVTISSGHKDAKINHSIIIHDGNMVDMTQSAYYKGTSIKIENLFYNMPVRRQFLKSSTKEINKIKKEVLLRTLLNPHIRFTLKINSKNMAIIYPSLNSFEDQIVNALPLLLPLNHFQYKDTDFSIEGFITGLNQTFPHSGNLYIFVNNHPIISKNFYAVIKKAVSGLIPNNQYLGGVIYIKTQPNNIDPNIHPAKKEIQIFNVSAILSKLYYIIIEALRDKPYEQTLKENQCEESVPIFQPTYLNSIEEKNYYPEINHYKPPNHTETSLDANHSYPLESSFDSMPISSLNENIPATLFQMSRNEENQYLYLGTLFGTYWLYEAHQILYMIDFHAAHERKRYEELKLIYDNRTIDSQGLLTPAILSISPLEELKYEQSLPMLKKMGFESQLIGENILSVSSYPSIYQKTKDWQEDLHLFLLEETLETALFPVKDYFLKRVACRYSYMSQDTVSPSERNLLADAVFKHQFPHTCPHGRPFIYTMQKQFIESHFLRK